MHIAMLGTRGIPARYGGFETYVEEVSTRLVERGHAVTVYCRAGHGADPPSVYKGVRLVALPSLRSKHLDTLSHTFASSVHLLVRNGIDVVQVCSLGNALLLPLLKTRRIPALLFVDGLDWKRSKWGWGARAYLRTAERIAAALADVLVTDSRVVASYYAGRFPRVPVYIGAGAQRFGEEGTEHLRTFGLEPNRYILFVGRLVPEKGVHLLVDAFSRLRTDMHLAIVGDDPFEKEYIASLRRMAGPNVLFLGPVYGEATTQLYAHAYAYVQPSFVEGTSPSLLKAMSAGRCVVVNGIPENLETIGEAGIAFRPNQVDDLRAVLERLLADPQEVDAYGALARARVLRHYTWDRITDGLERLYGWLLSSPRGTEEGTWRHAS